MGDIDSLEYDVLNRMEYLDSVVKESLRLSTPFAKLISRQTVVQQEITLADLVIKKGSLVDVNMYNTHLEEEYFEEPQAYRPERWAAPKSQEPGVYMPFSLGPRSCLGEKFATLEIKVVLALFMRQFSYALKSDVSKTYWETALVQ